LPEKVQGRQFHAFCTLQQFGGPTIFPVIKGCILYFCSIVLMKRDAGVETASVPKAKQSMRHIANMNARTMAYSFAE
jgi:hypothetical protein